MSKPFLLNVIHLFIFFSSHDIMSPVVPFALRLSSHLMIGVVRIYREQTKVVWSKYVCLHFFYTLNPDPVLCTNFRKFMIQV